MIERAAAVVRAAIEVLDRLQLRFREAGVRIDVVGAHMRCEIALRLEIARQRLIDDAIFDAIVRIAAREHCVGESLELAQALGRTVAVRIESEIAGKVVAEHALQQPRVACVQLLVQNTGAPATMPSKSFGKRCASMSPSRPPVEQPSKYERVAGRS